ncbi:MAG: grasp-with-spasm system SPASM domain peptide maturase [Aureispira sp.]|nr:grasp-with-spasm system SPASM domain peptide maturase [Aureispira sp.]
MHISKNERWFQLHSSCIPVKGKESSLIYDIEKQQLYPISNDHYELLSLCKLHHILELKEMLIDVSSGEVDAFLGHFVDNHLGFYTTSPNSFPDLELAWKSPSIITNGIIQINSRSTFSLKELIDQLHSLGCDAVQLRLEDDFNIELITEMITAFEETRIKLIDLILPYNSDLTKEVLFDLMYTYKRLGVLRLYNAFEDGTWEDSIRGCNVFLYTKDIRTNPIEIMHEGRFVTNPYVFMEAQQHNTGLNRKVCIDVDGNIKNYINHVTNWGNIKKDTLKAVVLTDEFQEKWFIKNDQIEKCRECPFRYCCVSNVDIEKRNERYYKLEDCPIN